MGSAVSLGKQGPQEEREFDSFYERAGCGWSARGVRGAWEARSETDAGAGLLGSSVRSLGCARWAESDMHHPPPHGRPAALALSTRVRGASQPRCHHAPVAADDSRVISSAPPPALPEPGVGRLWQENPVARGATGGDCGRPHHERPRAASWRGGPARQGSRRVLFTLSLQASLENAWVG